MNHKVLSLPFLPARDGIWDWGSGRGVECCLLPPPMMASRLGVLWGSLEFVLPLGEPPKRFLNPRHTSGASFVPAVFSQVGT
jgi:hypothetical protein